MSVETIPLHPIEGVALVASALRVASIADLAGELARRAGEHAKLAEQHAHESAGSLDLNALHRCAEVAASLRTSTEQLAGGVCYLLPAGHKVVDAALTSSRIADAASAKCSTRLTLVRQALEKRAMRGGSAA